MAHLYKVLVNGSNELPTVGVELLRAKGYAVDQWTQDVPMPRHVVLEKIKNVDAFFCLSCDQIDRELLEAAKKLKVVSTYSVGTDHIDKAALKERGIKLGYTPDVLTNACADFAVALTLTTLRRIPEGIDAVRKGEWTNAFRPVWLCGRAISFCKIGLLGFGRIGQAVARRFKPFEPVALAYHCLNRKEEIERDLGVEWRAQLDELLKEVDVLIITCALNDDTRRIMSKKNMSLMKHGSFLINVSRGGIVDQDDLLEMLEADHFGGVGLDVTTPEPIPPTHPLLKFTKCVVIPHLSSACYNTRSKMAEVAAMNIVNALEGQPMPAEFEL